MPAQFDRDGVSFAYPDSWSLEEDADDDARLSVTVTSPSTAFWTLVVYAEELDLQGVADQVVDALRKEYPELETSDAAETIAGHELVGVDANFICLDLTNTSRVRVWRSGASTFLTFCQAEDRELESADPVFRAITTSLLNE